MNDDLDGRTPYYFEVGSGSDDATVAPGDVFVDRIQRNPEVCSNCFAHIRDVVIPHSWKSEVRKGLVRFYVSIPDRVEPGKVDEDRAGNPPKACANCGSIRGATTRPLPKKRAIDYAWNLSRTLAELHLPHNPLTLAFVVAHRKRFPDFASADDDTFALAVEYALDATEYDMADVLQVSDTDPARIVRERGRFTTTQVRERTALPPGRGRAERKAYHGRPAIAREHDDAPGTDDTATDSA